jgi:hypothetical protein
MYNRHNFKIAETAAKESPQPALRSLVIDPERTSVDNGRLFITVSRPRVGQVPKIGDLEPAGNFKPFLIDGRAAVEIGKATPLTQEEGTNPSVLLDDKSTTADQAVLGIMDNGVARVYMPNKVEDVAVKREVPPAEDATMTVRVNPAVLSAALRQFESFQSGLKIKTVALSVYDDRQLMRMDAERSNTGQTMTAVIATKTKRRAPAQLTPGMSRQQVKEALVALEAEAAELRARMSVGEGGYVMAEERATIDGTLYGVMATSDGIGGAVVRLINARFQTVKTRRFKAEQTAWTFITYVTNYSYKLDKQLKLYDQHGELVTLSEDSLAPF